MCCHTWKVCLLRLDEAAQLLALALDCFDHSPWTSKGRSGRSGRPPLTTKEILHNWARRPEETASTWRWETPREQFTDPGFGSSLCRVQLGAACVDVSSGEISVASSTESKAYLQQCGDSYAQWRRIHLVPLSKDVGGKAWVLHFTPLAASNLWHMFPGAD